jgi:hypothetical protein
MDASAKSARANELVDRFVAAGSEEEVNIPAAMRKELLAAHAAATSACEPPGRSLFADAEEEVFKLMDRDTFARFRNDAEAVGKMVDDFFNRVDVVHDVRCCRTRRDGRAAARWLRWRGIRPFHSPPLTPESACARARVVGAGYDRVR